MLRVSLAPTSSLFRRPLMALMGLSLAARLPLRLSLFRLVLVLPMLLVLLERAWLLWSRSSSRGLAVRGRELGLAEKAVYLIANL